MNVDKGRQQQKSRACNDNDTFTYEMLAVVDINQKGENEKKKQPKNHFVFFSYGHKFSLMSI